jgi:hypothetical protein
LTRGSLGNPTAGQFHRGVTSIQCPEPSRRISSFSWS